MITVAADKKTEIGVIKSTMTGIKEVIRSPMIITKIMSGTIDMIVVTEIKGKPFLILDIKELKEGKLTNLTMKEQFSKSSKRFD